MSHTTFAFLVTCNPDQAPETTGKEAVASFEFLYAEDFCDENNWSTPEALVLKTGVVVPLCAAADSRGRDTLQKHFAALPAGQRWTEALRHCLLAAAYRLRIDGTVSFHIGLTPQAANQRFAEKAGTMSLEDLGATIQMSALTATAEALEDVSAALRARALQVTTHEPVLAAIHPMLPIPGFWDARDALDAYYIAEDTHIFPFAAALDTPYHNWCCYDLRDNQQDDEQVGILFVDIHT